MKAFSSICVKESKEHRTTRPHQLPLYATSSFEFEDIRQGMDIFTGKKTGHVYGRYGNPTIEAVAEKIAHLETHGLDIEAMGIMFSSGMSAISTLLMACLQSGDKILSQGNLYGGTTELLLSVLEPLGLGTVLCNLQDLSQVEEQLKSDPAIKMIYFETPANPTLACVDIAELTALAKRYHKYTAIDNTFCTPYLQQPFRQGVDFIIHSTTKYLNGHGNSIAGIVIGRDVTFMKDHVWKTMKLLGTNCNPWDAWLTNNGLKTLHLRMAQHSSNALQIAQFLDAHPQVTKLSGNE